MQTWVSCNIRGYRRNPADQFICYPDEGLVDVQRQDDIGATRTIGRRNWDRTKVWATLMVCPPLISSEHPMSCQWRSWKEGVFYYQGKLSRTTPTKESQSEIYVSKGSTDKVFIGETNTIRTEEEDRSNHTCYSNGISFKLHREDFSFVLPTMKISKLRIPLIIDTTSQVPTMRCATA